jgi:hypothetical protein
MINQEVIHKALEKFEQTTQIKGTWKPNAQKVTTELDGHIAIYAQCLTGIYKIGGANVDQVEMHIPYGC